MLTVLFGVSAVIILGISFALVFRWILLRGGKKGGISSLNKDILGIAALDTLLILLSWIFLFVKRIEFSVFGLQDNFIIFIAALFLLFFDYRLRVKYKFLK